MSPLSDSHRPPPTPSSPSPSPTAEARRLVIAGEIDAAQNVLAALIGEAFDLDVAQVSINRDGYSLNSLNGTVMTGPGAAYFFKFHQEEDEAAGLDEYYRADLLATAGYPVDQPSHASTEVGRQILLYPLRQTPRLADLCVAAEGHEPVIPADDLTGAQAALDRQIGAIMLETLHMAPTGTAAAEPIHQLFHHRLARAPFAREPGGRLARFYQDRPVELPTVGTDRRCIGWDDFAAARWIINGVERRDTVATVVQRSLVSLHPDRFDGGPAVTAHGDAHNANVWYDNGRLVYFDPAFAGRHVPALLAEIKATFHNIFAHPFWLYHPSRSTVSVTADYADGVITVSHDWTLTPLRAAFLDSKIRHVWQPLIRALDQKNALAPDWLDIVMLAMFCCPTLVLPLTPNPPPGFPPSHTASTALLGWAIAMAFASPPANASGDPVGDPVEIFRNALTGCR